MAALVPGLAVFVFWAAPMLGFHTAPAPILFIPVSLYDPAPHGELKTWIKRAVITAGFLALMNGLFAMLLNVYTPRETHF